MDVAFFHNSTKNSLHESRIFNLKGSSAALFFALSDEPFLALELNEERGQKLHRDINFFRNAFNKAPVFFLPDPNGPGLSGERVKVIYSLTKEDSLVSSCRNLGSVLWTRETIEKNALHLAKGMEVQRQGIEQKIRDMGYKNVALVSEKGEFSRRGWLMDVFPSTSENPLRIEFFGDEIENIKVFDIDTQRSGQDIPEYIIFPADDPQSGATLFQLKEQRRFFCSDAIETRDDIPADAVIFSSYAIQGHGYDAGVLPFAGLGILPEERKHVGQLPDSIKPLMKENRIVLVSSSKGQANRLKEILNAGGVVAPLIGIDELFAYGGTISITIGELSAGLYVPGFIVLTEQELFGGRTGYRPIKKSKVSGLLISLDDLRPGDFVVHKDHGIGKFHGLVPQTVEGVKEDLILVEYEGGRLYLPLHNITRINKYHCEEGVIPKIDRLGGKTWQRTKEKVRKKIQEMAEKLVALYAEREVSKGFSYTPDTELHTEFDDFFPYEETPDQVKAIGDIKRDMESERPMDRLICGDVGYGKTEVAMRAAFKAVYDGMQVAVLVPTTILCEQHCRIFRIRFSAFPVTIDSLSRFKSKKEQKETMKALSNGDIDIIIGTHSLLGNDVRFHKLGLLVIDEEHRFGVRQKEKLKELKKGVDVITLTATPIPRTLHMALSDIREMSIIETPPEERLAVRSSVSVFREDLIKEAVARERERNGQVFFVHNRIKDIYKIADYLTGLVPSIRVAVAHGQMSEKDLENAMLKFYEGSVDMLVSTAIIGSGLDIPTANTIIINRADMMGLADLYQLRGRVGRGNVKAYAYFLIPGDDLITEEAKKRLQAIQDMSYLGAGFRLALKDLEIRGAGNLLGAEQSGHIHAVGFDLYMEMLEKAVADIKGVTIEKEFEPSISLRVNAFIPEDYIEDVSLRLSMYRKIASSRAHEGLEAVKAELAERFGGMPGEVENLITIMHLKITARMLRIMKIQDANGKVRLLFSPDTHIEPKDMFALREKIGGAMRFLPDGIELNLEGLPWDAVYKKISYILDDLAKTSSLHV